MLPYPRFESEDVEDLFLHWLEFDKHHKNNNLFNTAEECTDCKHFKNCLDYGVMWLLYSIVESWHNQLKGSNASSLITGHMSEEELRDIYENVRKIKSDENYEEITKERLEALFYKYFPSIGHRHIFGQLLNESAHYLPFITRCVAGFKTLAVLYNDVLFNVKENYYYNIMFVFHNFHLNGLLAFSPGVVRYMWAESLPKSLIAWFYLKDNSEKKNN